MGPPKESILRHSARLTTISLLPSAYFLISLSLSFYLHACLFSRKRLCSYSILTYGVLSCLAGEFKKKRDRARNAEERRPGTNKAVTCTWIQWGDEGLSCPATMDCARNTLWRRTTESFALCSGKQSCCSNKWRLSEYSPDGMLTVELTYYSLEFAIISPEIPVYVWQNEEKQHLDKKNYLLHFSSLDCKAHFV